MAIFSCIKMAINKTQIELTLSSSPGGSSMTGWGSKTGWHVRSTKFATVKQFVEHMNVCRYEITSLCNSLIVESPYH